MNDWMTRLQRTLAKEGILSAPAKARLVPQQFYAVDLSQFIMQLKGFAYGAYKGKSFTVFVDGIPKKCLETGGTDIDAVFRQALHGAGFSVDWIVLSDLLGIAPTDFHASYHTVERTCEVLRTRRPTLCIVLGSGSITDVVKHAMFLEGMRAPFISVPTALTVTAFTSAFSVIDWHGAKRTQVSREVSASFWLESVLACAPSRMSRAGYGDLLARFLACGDWYLGKCLGMADYYDESAYRLMEPFAAGIRKSADGLLQHPLREETVRCVAASLAMAGIAMSVSGETTPLSGFEHVISHALDFLRLASGEELVLHGEQIALACLTSARVFDRLMTKNEIKRSGWLKNPVADGLAMLNSLINRAPLSSFGNETEKARQEFIKEYEKKSLRWEGETVKGAQDRFIDDWPDIKTHLIEITTSFTEMESLVRRAGLPCLPTETTPPTSQTAYDWAVRFSPFIRFRTSIADLIFWMGEDITKFI